MRDRFPLLFAGALVLAAALGAALIGGAHRGEFADRLSTYRSSEHGARALYLFAEESGLPVGRRTRSFSSAPIPETMVLLGIDAAGYELPSWGETRDGGLERSDREENQDRAFRSGTNELRSAPLSEDETKAMLAEVRKGRALIYAPWRRYSDAILDAAGVTLGEVGTYVPIRTVVPAQPSPFTSGVERIETEVRSFLALRGAAIPLLIDDRTGEVVASISTLGLGHIIVLGAPELADNEALARADNAQLWLSLLSTAHGNAPIRFDEHHHGFSEEPSIADFGRRYGLHWAIAQLLLGLCCWAAALRRFGRPVLPDDETRSSAGDVLGATSRLYREGKHCAHAAGLVHRALAQELAPLAGQPNTAEPKAIADGLRVRGQPALAAALTEIAQRASSAQSEADVISVAKAAARARQLLPRARRGIVPAVRT